MLLEVCVDSFDSAIIALDNGANRLEICGCLGLGGGVSPSFALVHRIRRARLDASLMVMVRPRPGDFVYDQSEIDLMIEEIQLLKSIDPPIQGVVLGCLTSEGSIDLSNLIRLTNTAVPFEITFHRAFDMILDDLDSDNDDPFHAIRALTGIGALGPGVTRILTSGLAPTLATGIGTFLKLTRYVDDGDKETCSSPPLRLLPASGIDARSLQLTPLGAVPKNGEASLLTLLRQARVKEVHASCSSWSDGPMKLRREGMGMGVGGGNEFGRWRVDEEKVRSLRRLLDGTEVQAARQ